MKDLAVRIHMVSCPFGALNHLVFLHFVANRFEEPGSCSKRIEVLGAGNASGSIRFWFENDVTAILKNRHEQAGDIGASPREDGVIFKENYFYCDGSQGTENSLRLAVGIVIDAKYPQNFSDILDTYNKNYCTPARDT